jgi:dihydroorotase
MSIHGPLFDMPTCLSKFLALGMAFPDVIRAATARPAEVLGFQHELGTLRVGALADLALFTIQPGRFPFYDVFMNMREGTQLIRNTLTIVNGRPLRRTPDAAPAPWIELSAGQRALLDRGHTPDAFAK